MSRSSRLSALAVSAVVLVGIGSAPAAHAAVSGAAKTWVASPTGVVGVQQSVVIKAGAARKTAGKVATFTFTDPAGGVNAGQAIVNSAGFAALAWMPNDAGAWSVSASVGGVSIAPTSVTVAAMPTDVSLLVPAQVGAGVATTVLVEVSAVTGPITPGGTITLRDQNGGTVGTGTLAPTSTAGMAMAQVGWTPSAGTTSLTALYTPATTAFASSSSEVARPAIGGTPNLTMRMPESLYNGEAVTLTAITSAGMPAGGVAFSLNIGGFVFYPMGGSQGINTGPRGVDFAWTPTQVGFQSVGLSYASNDFQTNANVSQAVDVLPAPVADAITVTPAGSAAWGPGAVGSLPAGSSLGLAATSTSGNPVVLTTDGPCQLDGSTLTVLSAGNCSLMAHSLGNGDGLAASTSTYTVAIS